VLLAQFTAVTDSWTDSTYCTCMQCDNACYRYWSRMLNASMSISEVTT